MGNFMKKLVQFYLVFIGLNMQAFALENSVSKQKYDHHLKKSVSQLYYQSMHKLVSKFNKTKPDYTEMHAILKALEPKYDEMFSDSGPMHMGFTRKYQKAIFESLKLWQDPLCPTIFPARLLSCLYGKAAPLTGSPPCMPLPQLFPIQAVRTQA